MRQNRLPDNHHRCHQQYRNAKSRFRNLLVNVMGSADNTLGDGVLTDSDGASIEESVDGAFRTAVTQAAALGRMVAQMREQALHKAANQDRAIADDMRRRYDAEKQRALVTLHQADHDGWWNTASTQ